MNFLYFLESPTLGDIPWWTWVGGAIVFIGLIIWRYLRRKYPSLAKIERFFDDFNRNEAVSTSINDAYPRVEVEDFPPHPISEEIKSKLTKAGEVTLGAGIYDFYLQSFCIGAGKYAPTTGSGYLIAPLIKGTKSSVIKNILKNSIKQLISQQTIQTLIWAIESGSKYDEMPSNLQSTMDQLLNKDEIKSLRKNFWERIPKGILNIILAGVKSKLPQDMLQMFNAYNAIKELILDPNTSYENLIATAVRYGEPSPPENMIKIESGEWCETPDGYFIRALTRDSFSRLRIQIYVPESNVSPNNNPDLHNPNTEDMKITFDPSKIIAVPANTNKQRLGLRPKEKEEEEPKVIITGAKHLILCKEEEGRGSPLLLLHADGTPSGGSYRWSLVEGTDKVEILGATNTKTLQLHPIKPSQDRNDVVVRVDYSCDEGFASNQVALTAHKPSYSCVVSRTKRTFNGDMTITVLGGKITLNNGPYYGYETIITYRILDQFRERFPEQIIFLEEDLTIEYDPFNTPFIESDFISEPNAEYYDFYATIFEKQPVPPNYVARVRQIVKAEGFVILNHILLYGPADLVVGARGCNP